MNSLVYFTGNTLAHSSIAIFYILWIYTYFYRVQKSLENNTLLYIESVFCVNFERSRFVFVEVLFHLIIFYILSKYFFLRVYILLNISPRMMIIFLMPFAIVYICNGTKTGGRSKTWW